MPRFTINHPTHESENLDVCRFCVLKVEDERSMDESRDDFDVAHPPYQEQYPAYTCVRCGTDLTARDNHYPENI